MDVQTTTERFILPGPVPMLATRVFQAAPARPAPLVLHMPGGTFAGVPVHRPVAALLAQAGAVVVSVDYPSGPAHPFPEALEALYLLLTQLHAARARWAARRSPVLVAGEEAGGNLAAALALMARDRLGPPLAGQVLLSPMLDVGMATCSFRDAKAGPVGCKWADGWALYLRRAAHAAHPYAVPARGTRLGGLPPALLVTTPDDPMRDECLAYAGRLREAGVAVRPRALSGRDWPDALAAAEPDAAWSARLRAEFAAFFAAVTPGLVPAPEPIPEPEMVPEGASA